MNAPAQSFAMISAHGSLPSVADLFLSHREMVYRTCLRWLGHHHDAEDMTQETFRRAALAIRSFDPQRPIEPWLVAIAGNRCRTFLSRRGREKTDQSIDQWDAEPLSIHSNRGPREQQAFLVREWIDRALDELPADQRRAFELIHQEELSYPEAAEAMGRSIGTIKTWVHRARKSMRQTWYRDDVRRSVVVSVASLLFLVACWSGGGIRLPTIQTATNANTGNAVAETLDLTSHSSAFTGYSDQNATAWQLTSLRLFSQTPVAFQNIEQLPPDSLPIERWIQESTPVINQLRNGIAPVERTLRGMMGLFASIPTPPATVSREAPAA